MTHRSILPRSKPSSPTEDYEVVRDANADKSKAAFKFELLQTVNADPQMKPADLAVILAYSGFMAWPSRECWLSTSRARAMTGLSERQVITSRARLAKRGYMAKAGKSGTATLYRLCNERASDMQQHVAIATEVFREHQKDRQAERRRLWRFVHADRADTDFPCHTQHSDCDVSANSAGKSSENTSESLALKKEHQSTTYAKASGGW